MRRLTGVLGWLLCQSHNTTLYIFRLETRVAQEVKMQTIRTDQIMQASPQRILIPLSRKDIMGIKLNKNNAMCMAAKQNSTHLLQLFNLSLLLRGSFLCLRYFLLQPFCFQPQLGLLLLELTFQASTLFLTNDMKEKTISIFRQRLDNICNESGHIDQFSKL